MRKSIIARVSALERYLSLGSEPTAKAPMRIILLIALELGDLEPHESIAEGYSRALGYDRMSELKNDIAQGETGLSTRHSAATAALVERYAADLSDAPDALDFLVAKHVAAFEQRGIEPQTHPPI